MWSTLTNLVLHKQMVFGDGVIQIFGQPVVLAPLRAELNLLQDLEKRGLENVIYWNAKNAGREWFKGMSEIYGIKPQDIMKWGPELINLGGWGTVKPFTANLQSAELDFVLLNSSFAKLYGKSSRPIDHLFRGLLTGAWENATSKPIEGVETECAAVGAKACKFILRPMDKHDFTNSEVKRQLSKP
jgi:predicted hydrocarbon binding protein